MLANITLSQEPYTCVSLVVSNAQMQTDGLLATHIRTCLTTKFSLCKGTDTWDYKQSLCMAMNKKVCPCKITFIHVILSHLRSKEVSVV